MIVNDFDRDGIFFVALLEVDFLVQLNEVIARGSSVISSAHTDAAGMILVLVDDGDYGVADAFGN